MCCMSCVHLGLLYLAIYVDRLAVRGSVHSIQNKMECGYIVETPCIPRLSKPSAYTYQCL
jgi:hypothetical protein